MLAVFTFVLSLATTTPLVDYVACLMCGPNPRAQLQQRWTLTKADTRRADPAGRQVLECSGNQQHLYEVLKDVGDFPN